MLWNATSRNKRTRKERNQKNGHSIEHKDDREGRQIGRKVEKEKDRIANASTLCLCPARARTRGKCAARSPADVDRSLARPRDVIKTPKDT